MRSLMPRHAVHALGALLIAGTTGCENPFVSEMCTLELRPTISVEVTDARTAAAIPVGSTVIVRGSSFYDSVLVRTPLWTPSMAYTLMEDRAGVGRYTVEVRKPGYATFVRNDVDVIRDGCHLGPGPLVEAKLLLLP